MHGPKSLAEHWEGARRSGHERAAPPSRANPGVSAIRPVPSVYRARSQGVVALTVRRVAQRCLRESRALVPRLCVFGDAANQEKEPEHKSYCSGRQHVHLPLRAHARCMGDRLVAMSQRELGLEASAAAD